MADSTIDFTPVRDRVTVDVLPTKEPAHLPPAHPRFTLLQGGPRISTYDFPPPLKRPAGLSKRASQLALKLARRLLNHPKPDKGLTDAERQARDAYLVQSNVERFARGEMGWETVQGPGGKTVDLTSPRDESFARATLGCQDWESVLGADQKTLVATGVAPTIVVHDEAVLEKDPPEQNAPKGASSKDREAEKRKKCLSTVLEARESVILDGFPVAAEKYPFPKEPATDLPGSSLGVLPVRYEDHLPVEQLAIDVKAAWHADDGAEPSRMKRILSLQSIRFAEKQAREREERKAVTEAKTTSKVEHKRILPKRGLKKSLSMHMQRFASTTSLLRAAREDAAAAESAAANVEHVIEGPSRSGKPQHTTPVVRKPCPPRPPRSPQPLQQSPSMRNMHYAEQLAAPPGIKIMVDPLTADHPSLRNNAFSDSVPPPIPEKSPARAMSSNNLLHVQSPRLDVRKLGRTVSVPVLTAQQLPRSLEQPTPIHPPRPHLILRLRADVPSEKSQYILLASLNSIRVAARIQPLVIKPILGMRIQNFAATELPPLPPSKPATKARRIGTQVIRDQMLSDATQARATVLVSPPNMGEMALGELWRSGKYKRHKSVAGNHEPGDHRYTLFPTFDDNTDFDGYDFDDIVEPEGGPAEVGEIVASEEGMLTTSDTITSKGVDENAASAQEACVKSDATAPVRFEPEGQVEHVINGAAARCACLEYNAYEVVVDTKWTAIGVGKSGDGRWVVGFS
ncbi:hypothetical protein B0A48_07583 [Cryoendolithus antarcticus]|uniref:Uncharacterized protein n=1 Tax=Cryoendolithus antarcticus TaxID=1507870 RepID=A0A1V8T6I5_9PEZI|nr:hypothetical protein B0A48_07583 [Cryoendolithus antarcticus]